MQWIKGKFKPLPPGHEYALTVIDMLTNYTLCIHLHTKEANEIGYAYLVYLYYMFDGLHKILSDKGSEFKNKLFTQFTSTLGMKQVFTSQ